MKNIYYESKTDKLTHPKIDKRTVHYEMPLHFHENIELMYITSDSYTTTINNEEIVAEPCDIVFTPSFYIHSGKGNPALKVIFYTPVSSNTIQYAELLRKRTLPFLMNDKEFNRNVILPFLEYFSSHTEQTTNEIIMQSAFNIIFGNLIAHYGTFKKVEKESSSFIVSIIRYIDEHYKEPLSLEEVAAQHGYSKFYFSRMFNQLIGRSFSDYVNHVRIQKFIKIYSKNKNTNINSLIKQCGFSSISSFYRNFNKIYGQKPIDYLTNPHPIYWQ